MKAILCYFFGHQWRWHYDRSGVKDFGCVRCGKERP